MKNKKHPNIQDLYSIEDIKKAKQCSKETGYYPISIMPGNQSEVLGNTNGNVATIEHIAVFFHNRFSKCTAKAYYNAVDKKIEKFKFDNVDLFKFTSRFMY